MFLIHSKIVPAGQDAFWQSLPDSWYALTHRDVTILTQPYAPGSPEEQTLTRMLGACRLSPEQYHILPLDANQPVAWHKLRDQLRPRQVLLLGIAPAQLGIAALFRLHEPNSFDGSTFIPALSLAEMERQPEAKKDFWAKGLKPVFVP